MFENNKSRNVIGIIIVIALIAGVFWFSLEKDGGSTESRALGRILEIKGNNLVIEAYPSINDRNTYVKVEMVITPETKFKKTIYTLKNSENTDEAIESTGQEMAGQLSDLQPNFIVEFVNKGTMVTEISYSKYVYEN